MFMIIWINFTRRIFFFYNNNEQIIIIQIWLKFMFFFKKKKRKSPISIQYFSGVAEVLLRFRFFFFFFFIGRNFHFFLLQSIIITPFPLLNDSIFFYDLFLFISHTVHVHSNFTLKFWLGLKKRFVPFQLNF